MQVVARAKQVVPKLTPPRETDLRGYWVAVSKRRTLPLRAKAEAVDEELGRCCRWGPGILEYNMQRRNNQRKPGTTRWSPRRRAVGRTARTSRINRAAAKSRCAGEWGGWGRLSDDGPGHYNPDRSEGPRGKAADATCTVVYQRLALPDSEPVTTMIARGTKGGRKLHDAKNSQSTGRPRLINRP